MGVSRGIPKNVSKIGGMHALVSFARANESNTLVDESGVSGVLSVVSGSVAKIPQNLRALRLLTEEILRNLNVHTHECAADPMEEMNEKAQGSKTARLSVDVLIKPVLLMMAFIRAERGRNWLLHLDSFRQMLTYYFAAGHFNYTRYELLYLMTMDKLQDHALQHFLKDENVVRHLICIWNGIWSDMFMETTFMRFGHSKGGIVGITLKRKAVKVRALSRHLCRQIISNLNEMEKQGSNRYQWTHTREKQGLKLIPRVQRDCDAG